MAAGSGAVVGTLAGPVRTAFGAGIGFAIDFLTNEGIEIMKREEFIKEINEIIESTQKTYQRTLEYELQRIIFVLAEDSMQLLPKAINKSDL